MGQTEYCLGRFKLQPRRQLTQDGVRVPLGQKALDLLSALAEAEGELVTKDELVARVWPQAIVDDNTIQVQVATARKALGEDARLLSTVRGLGYRLDVSAASSPMAPVYSPPGRTIQGVSQKHVVWVLLGLIGLGAAITGMILAKDHDADRRSKGVLIAVAPFQSRGQDESIREFSNGLSEKVSSALSKDHLEVTSDQANRTNRRWAISFDQKAVADLRISGSVWKTGSTYDIYAHLDDPRRGLMIWSSEFQGTASPSEAALQTSIASRVAEAAYWANVGRSGPVKLDPPALAAFIAGREGTTGLRDGAAILNDYQKVTNLSPDFSWGHSAIAAETGFRLLAQPTTPNAQAVRALGQSEARQALALDKHNGEAYLALELLTPRAQWQRRERFLLQGANLDRSFEPVALMEGRLLEASGRGHAAMTWLELAHDLAPLHNGATFTLVLNRASQGQTDESRTLLDRMRLDWPDHPATRNAEFWLHLMGGEFGSALAMLADSKTRPPEMDEMAAEAWRLTLQVLLSGNLEAKSRARIKVQLAVKANSLDHGEAAVLLTMMGDLDAGFEQAQQYEIGEPIDPPYLFLPLTRPMRRDRRFMTVAHKLGLIAYWRSTGDWPDFCSEPSLPYDCHAEAMKAEP